MPSIEKYRPWLLPIGLLACLVVILVPLPTAIMDLLLAGNIALAVVILLTAIHVASPLEFSVFPTLLLATTLSRLVLNIATTRLILSNAPVVGEDAAGGVIQTFGQFVAGNQIEIGLVIFSILVVVQFVVITKGATRISEVAARFALDGMPGRQSAIDADLSSGNIDAETASAKRDALVAEADFYSAMDGAGKFVRGDAIAGLAITAINIVGGLYLGIKAEMGIAQAAEVFTKLTIGDGLVSQIPSLLISLSAGVLVTRGTRPADLPDHFVTQLLGNSKSLAIAGVFLLVLMVTGLPPIPLLLLGVGFMLIASTIRRGRQQAEIESERQRQAESAAAANTQKRVEDFLAVDPLEVAIGLGLLPLADPSRGGDLMPRIASLRNQMAAEIGIVLPKVRVRDDATLDNHAYEIRLFGDFVARGELRVDKLLASGNGTTTGTLEGEQAAADSNSVWIDPVHREQALIYGFKTQTAPGVLADHLEQVARSHADELLSHDATKHLLDELRQVAPAMVESLVPGRLAISDVQKVLQGLLREAIPIRQLGIIMEALGDAATRSDDTDQHVERIRKRLARTICAQLRDEYGTMHVVALDGPTVDALSRSDDGAGQGGVHADSVADHQFPLSSNKSLDVTCDAIRQAVKKLTSKGFPPVMLVDPNQRRQMKSFAERSGIWVHVLSTDEITPETHLEQYSIRNLNPTSAAA